MAKPKVHSGPRDERLDEMIAHSAIRVEDACRRKARYPTQNDARHAAKAVAARKRKDMKTYKCTWCGHYHISTDRSEAA